MDREPVFTRHARRRIAQMELTDDEVNDALLNPQLSWRSIHDGKLREVRRAGRVAVVLTLREGEHDIVVSVLWNTYKKYQRKD
jgi:hypothetical protein